MRIRRRAEGDGSRAEITVLAVLLVLVVWVFVTVWYLVWGTAEEFEERLGSVHAARTWADLGTVRGDLPMMSP